MKLFTKHQIYAVNVIG